MISCPSCGKQNQDHYKFCLGCGAELPREAPPSSTLDETAPHKIPVAASDIVDEPTAGGIGPEGDVLAAAVSPATARPEAPPVQPAAVAPGAPPAAPAPAAAPAPPEEAAPADKPPNLCPQCDHPNPETNRFCASCGFKLGPPQKSQTKPPPSAPAEEPAGGEVAAVITALNPDGAEAGSFP